jgi:hypothetical protein
MPRPPHSPWSDLPNNIWWWVQIMKLPTVHLSSFSCYFTPLRYFVLRYSFLRNFKRLPLFLDYESSSVTSMEMTTWVIKRRYEEEKLGNCLTETDTLCLRTFRQATHEFELGEKWTVRLTRHGVCWVTGTALEMPLTCCCAAAGQGFIISEGEAGCLQTASVLSLLSLPL